MGWKLNNRNYFSRKAQTEYMSASQFKDFQKCEAAALARIRGRIKEEQSTALLVGSYVDAYFEGKLDVFITEHPEVFKRDGNLKSDYSHAVYIIQRIRSQRAMVKALGGDHQVIFTGIIAGVPFKCKVDSYLPGKAIVDGKVMKDFAPIYREGEGRVPWYEAWGYDLQGAIYQELVRQVTGKQLPFILAAATKEPEPDLALIQLDQDGLDYEINRVAELAPRYDAIKKGVIQPTRCETCPYCRRTKRVRLISQQEWEAL